jgi:lysyl-tRNA synthetase class II
MLFRAMGKLNFAQLRDGTHDIQVVFVKDRCRLHTGHALVDTVQVQDQAYSPSKFVEKWCDI